jgi:hypothetical protein
MPPDKFQNNTSHYGTAASFRIPVNVVQLLILILIYLSTAVGLTPGGSTHLHTNNT